MRNIKLTIQYDGSLFYGWQLQKHLPSVQGALVDAIEELFLEKVELKGAGRTDVGVHALGQVANFKTNKNHELYHIITGINHFLVPGIQVRKAEEVDLRFHSRFSAISKTYRYYLSTERYMHPIYRKYKGNWWGPIDIEKMVEASKILLGTHDFTSFQNNKEEEINYIRTIDTLEIYPEGKDIVFVFEGESFLHNMVRILVGSLLEIGKGKRNKEWLEQAIIKRNRKAAGPAVSACGLYLWEIEYGKN